MWVDQHTAGGKSTWATCPGGGGSPRGRRTSISCIAVFVKIGLGLREYLIAAPNGSGLQKEPDLLCGMFLVDEFVVEIVSATVLENGGQS